MLHLKGKYREKRVEIELGWSILEHALKHEVDWGFSCTRGTCARCRCQIEQGAEHLSEPNEAEFNRLDEEEIDEGFRLGCQAKIVSNGSVRAVNKTYF